MAYNDPEPITPDDLTDDDLAALRARALHREQRRRGDVVDELEVLEVAANGCIVIALATVVDVGDRVHSRLLVFSRPGRAKDRVWHLRAGFYSSAIPAIERACRTMRERVTDRRRASARERHGAREHQDAAE